MLNHTVKKHLLATSCLVVSLSCISPSMAMRNGKEEDRKQSSPSLPAKKAQTVQSSSKIPHPVPLLQSAVLPIQAFDVKAWNSRFVANKEKAIEELSHEASAGNPTAQGRLYDLSTLGRDIPYARGAEVLRSRLTIKKDDVWAVQVVKNMPPDSGVLAAGWNQNFLWARQKIRKMLESSDETSQLNAHLFLYNQHDNIYQSEHHLSLYYAYNSDYTSSFEKWDQMDPKSKEQLVSDFKQKWEKIPYAKPFYDVATVLGEFPAKDAKECEQKFLEIAADKGDLIAKIELADFLKESTPSRVLDLCKDAAERRVSIAMYSLGQCYEEGYGAGPSHRDKAVEWYTEAAGKGVLEAMFRLGVLSYCTDLKEAEKWFTRAAEKGHVRAMNHLAALFEAQKKLEEAVKWAKRAATKGYVPAKIALGKFYMRGWGTPVDAAKAIQQFTEAATQTKAEAGFDLTEQEMRSLNAKAFFILGFLYEKGCGTQPIDKGKAIQSYTEAATQGNVEAMFSLSTFYRLGYDTQKPDMEKEIYWLIEAEKRGHVPAINSLGVLYWSGYHGTREPNISAAVKKYTEAAEKGSEFAMHNLGICYESGFAGQAPSREKALEWYEQAAEHGCAEAFTKLGTYCLNLNQLQKAHLYLEKAKELGDKNAAIFLEQAALSQQLETPEQDATLAQALENSLVPATHSESLDDVVLSVDQEVRFPLPPIPSSLEQPPALVQKNTENSLDPIRAALSESLKGTPQLQRDSGEKASSLSAPLVPTSTTPLASTSDFGERFNSSLDSDDGKENPETEEAPSISVQLPAETIDVDPKQTIQNPKYLRYLRAQLRLAKEALEAEKERLQSFEKKVHVKKITAHSQGVINALDHINFDSLKGLFSDPYFGDQVEVKKTKSGVKIAATHYITNAVIITSTHRPHDQSVGYDPNFIKKIRDILVLFGVSET